MDVICINKPSARIRTVVTSDGVHFGKVFAYTFLLQQQIVLR